MFSISPHPEDGRLIEGSDSLFSLSSPLVSSSKIIFVHVNMLTFTFMYFAKFVLTINMPCNVFKMSSGNSPTCLLLLLHPQVACVFGLVQRTSGGLTGSFHILTELSWEGARTTIILHLHSGAYALIIYRANCSLYYSPAPFKKTNVFGPHFILLGCLHKILIKY